MNTDLDIRRITGRIFSGVVVLMIVGGCQMHRPAPAPDVVDATPVPVDEAMRRRNWAEQPAVYARTGSPGWPTLFLFDPQHDPKYNSQGLLDTPIFLGNVAMMPVAFFWPYPAWKEVESKGSVTPPTYTGVPPLPPEDSGE